MSEFDPAGMADGLWKRLRDVILVAERVDTFVFGPGQGDELPKVELDARSATMIARDFVLRSLRAVSDGVNFSILEAAAGEDGIEAVDLAAALGLPILVVSERVGELMQTGLAAKALDTGRVYATGAGIQAVSLVRQIAERLAETAVRARGPEGSKHELPLL